MKRTKLLLILALGTALGLAGCGKDEPTEQPPKENFGGGLGKSYNDMLQQSRDAADQANRQAQDVERRSHPQE